MSARPRTMAFGICRALIETPFFAASYKLDSDDQSGQDRPASSSIRNVKNHQEHNPY